MWTIAYKGYWIHGYAERGECIVTASNLLAVSRPFKSLHAAKCWITRVTGGR